MCTISTIDYQCEKSQFHDCLKSTGRPNSSLSKKFPKIAQFSVSQGRFPSSTKKFKKDKSQSTISIIYSP